MEKRHTDSQFRADLVPRWAKIAARGTVASVLPSVIWRMQMALRGLLIGDDPCANPEITPVSEWVYIIAILPTVQLGLAVLTLGLIRPWGEVFPRRLPFLGGGRVPVGFAAATATLGALAVAGFLVFASGDNEPSNVLPPGCEQPGREVLVFYAPMVLWPPLLLAVTWHYVRRRRVQ